MRTKINIRRAITERGYTITSFCQKFDLKTQNIIQNYIKGNPTIKRLEDLCEKLDCDITDLFYPIDGLEATEDNVPLLNNENEERNKNKKDVQPVVNTPPSALIVAQRFVWAWCFCPNYSKIPRQASLPAVGNFIIWEML